MEWAASPTKFCANNNVIVDVEQSVIRHVAKGFMYLVNVGVVTSKVPFNFKI